MNKGGKIMCECKNWVPTEIDYKTVDWEGKPLLLQIPAEVCPSCGESRVDADVLSVCEQKKIGEMLNLKPEEMEILWFLHAPGPRFTKRGYVDEKYRFNKMLFYLWMRLVENGFGKSLIHDSFESEKRGPVPLHLKENSSLLEKKGLVKMQWGGKKEKKPYKWELTEKGHEIAETLWNKTPNIYKQKVTEVKRALFLIDRTELMHKVHAEYPEYKKVYTKEDDE